MNKNLVLPAAIAAMLLLVATAFVFDCVRMFAGAQQRVAQADDELKQPEQRLVTLLQGFDDLSPAVREAISAYQNASGRVARHAAYDKLVGEFRKTTLADVDPTNPLTRRFMDDVAGAINRRDVVEKQYQAEQATYRELLDSFRGRVAQRFDPALAPDTH